MYVFIIIHANQINVLTL